ncbi:MAG: hypothetical protein LBH04_07835 [Tannerellaceae bacterium]|nr:hypothetical protein [Tannerellaceae bacterium]
MKRLSKSLRSDSGAFFMPPCKAIAPVGASFCPFRQSAFHKFLQSRPEPDFQFKPLMTAAALHSPLTAMQPLRQLHFPHTSA